MATYAERFKIEQDSRADPLAPPPGSTAEDITNARAFRVKVRSAVCDVAEEVLAAPGADASGRAPQVAWARHVLERPDQTAEATMRMLLARFDGLTPAQVFEATDVQVHDAIEALVPVLALGFDVRR